MPVALAFGIRMKFEGRKFQDVVERSEFVL